jgi:long-chain fatty acid transport protein
MMMFEGMLLRQGIYFIRLLCLLPWLLPGSASASNGFNLSGYGGESEAMGGADTAVSSTTFAVNSNPAGLAQTKNRILDLYLAPWLTKNTHSDSVGNDHELGDLPAGGFVAGGYAKHLANTPFTLGIGLFVQGGAGFRYENLHTPFSNAGLAPRDELSSLFAIIKLAPALAWKIDEHWSVGAAVGLNYASADQKFLPATSVPGFQGFTFKRANGIGFSGRVGVQYRPNDDLSVGLVYAGKANIPLKGGKLRANYSSNGLGTVEYADARLDGFRLPQEIAIGVAFRPVRPLLVALEYKWYNWSAVVNDLTLIASNPNSSDPAVAPAVILSSPINLRDQHVASMGLVYDYSGATSLLLGLNYARRAQPDETLNPVLSLIQAPHIMLGMNRLLNPQWNLISSVELYPTQRATNPTVNPVFGANMHETQSGIVLHFNATRRW